MIFLWCCRLLALVFLRKWSNSFSLFLKIWKWPLTSAWQKVASKCSEKIPWFELNLNAALLHGTQALKFRPVTVIFIGQGSCHIKARVGRPGQTLSSGLTRRLLSSLRLQATTQQVLMGREHYSYCNLLNLLLITKFLLIQCGDQICQLGPAGNPWSTVWRSEFSEADSGWPWCDHYPDEGWHRWYAGQAQRHRTT